MECDVGGCQGPSVSRLEMYRRAATFVDKIFKGANLGGLKTAKALGLTISPSLLGRADEVIQRLAGKPEGPRGHESRQAALLEFITS